VRHRHRQPAVDARRRACDVIAGAYGRALRGKRWSPPRQLARRRKLVSPLFHSAGLAYFYRAGFDVPPPVGAGGVREAVRPLLSPFANVRPSRRAGGAGGRATTGKGSFPMAMAGTVKFFNAERGYGFIKPDDGGRDVFVHVTAVERAGLKSLAEGQRISFDVEPDKKGKGPKAVNLVITG